jgi:inorganic pyrophosphatase
MENDLSLDVFIEIAKGSPIKYEYDKKREALVCYKILHTPFKYEFNYGFIPETLSPNGDTLDVVVIMDDELIPGSYINCKFLGYLETEDDHKVDTKILMCPSNKITPTYNAVLDICDISAHTIDKIKYFFQHYKDLENKQVKIGKVYGKSEAIAVYLNSAINYEVNSKSVKNKINSYFDKL